MKPELVVRMMNYNDVNNASVSSISCCSSLFSEDTKKKDKKKKKKKKTNKSSKKSDLLGISKRTNETEAESALTISPDSTTNGPLTEKAVRFDTLARERKCKSLKLCLNKEQKRFLWVQEQEIHSQDHRKFQKSSSLERMMLADQESGEESNEDLYWDCANRLKLRTLVVQTVLAEQENYFETHTKAKCTNASEEYLSKFYKIHTSSPCDAAQTRGLVNELEVKRFKQKQSPGKPRQRKLPKRSKSGDVDLIEGLPSDNRGFARKPLRRCYSVDKLWSRSEHSGIKPKRRVAPNKTSDNHNCSKSVCSDSEKPRRRIARKSPKRSKSGDADLMMMTSKKGSPKRRAPPMRSKSASMCRFNNIDVLTRSERNSGEQQDGDLYKLLDHLDHFDQYLDSKSDTKDSDQEDSSDEEQTRDQPPSKPKRDDSSL